MGETGKWDLILRFLYQVPYGQSDPLFDKDIGFYLFSLPAYVALKNWMLLILLLSTAHGRCGVLACTATSVWTAGPGAFRPPPSPMAPRCWASISR